MAMTKLVNGVRVNMDPTEEAAKNAEEQDWEANIKPVEERKRAFLEAKLGALTFDEEERDILADAFLEVQLYRIDNTVDTPAIDGFQSVFTGQTKQQIALTIESRYKSYKRNASIALAQKIKSELQG